MSDASESRPVTVWAAKLTTGTDKVRWEQLDAPNIDQAQAWAAEAMESMEEVVSVQLFTSNPMATLRRVSTVAWGN